MTNTRVDRDLTGPPPRVRPAVTVRDAALRPQQQRIALLTIFAPALGTAAALWLALERGFTTLDLGFLVGGIVFGQLFLELGYHRLFAHRSFQTKPWMRALLAVGGSMCAQGRVLHWVANHRRHHIHSETLNDPHSPHVRARRDGNGAEPLGLLRGLVHAQWGHMLTDDVPNGTLFARDLNSDPVLRWVNGHYALCVAAGLVLPALLGWTLTGVLAGALSGLLWGGFARMFVVQNVTWSVASACHRFGSAPFEAGDQSRNLWWAGWLSFGSGYQNTHHAFPNSAFLGLRWWEFDVTAWAIRALASVGWVWNPKRLNARELDAKRRPLHTSTRPTHAVPEHARR